MSRPTGDADKRLIEAALELIPRTGLAGLKVREVARRAGVNLGMYHYHFKGQAEFHRRVLDALYERFFSRFTGAIESTGGKSPRERLERAILAAARFIRENRGLLYALARDLLAENAEVMSFLRKNFPRHVFLLIGLIRDCQKAGVIRPLPLVQVLPFLFASVAGPVFAMGFIAGVLPAGIKGLTGAVLKHALASDRILEERIDMALFALGPAYRRGKGR